MLQLSYVGIAFAAVFYVAFGIAVRLMELSDTDRNKARLWIVVISLSSFIISNYGAGILNLMMGRVSWGIVFLILGTSFGVILGSIFLKLHNIKVRIKMRRFMLLFDTVEKYMNEGKTKEEILDYLTKSQKLARKDAVNFLNFISDPTNYKFLSDVNNKIREARMLTRLK
ncbi:hypothetical protein [Butyrivibrio sp. INlla21]|uniref:hypothetical protein n=1 Tax=Butyrivibrio sp. INlla21 TaxID=1520811 RepID=UPI0008F45740|nr:hypothetical protein [Butyrivibrio sp. INlla21]SFU54409.1 hypothetical protein SAMN02910342_00863 [Butyrivibrio sp. INlla21]